ncbi:MAG: hypothetical protein NTY74_14955 [Ignavibacteriae bacterium]|nr:hypothetical protein [Ignavibacteriota bacterium]
MSNKNNIVLTKMFLNLDFRNSGDSGFKKLIGLIITYLFVNTMMSFGSFTQHNQDVFVFMALTVNLFQVGFIVISDYSNLFFTNKYTDVLKSLPVREENIFVSKVTSALVYLSVYPFVMALPPSVFIYFYNHSIADSLMFALISFVFSYFIISLVFLLNSLIVIRSKGKSKILIFVFQMVFISFIFIINKYSGRHSGSADFLALGFVKFFPQYYLLFVYNNSLYLLPYFIITALLLFVNYVYFRKNYYNLSEIVNGSTKHEKRRKLFTLNLKPIENIILRNNVERSSFYLTKNLFNANSILKLRLVPVLLLPVIATGIAVFSDGHEMLIISGLDKLSPYEIYALSPSITLTIIMAANLVYSSTKISFEEDENIQSLFAVLPVENRLKFLKGVNKFVSLYLVFPVSVLCLGLVLFTFPHYDVLLNFVYLFAFISLFNTVSMKFDKVYPFTVPATKFNNSTKYFNLLGAILLGIVLVASQIFVFKNILFFITAIFVILAVKVLLNKIYS